jgi:hypothetical protein
MYSGSESLRPPKEPQIFLFELRFGAGDQHVERIGPEAEQGRYFLRGVTARTQEKDLGLDGLELGDDGADTVTPLFGEQCIERVFRSFVQKSFAAGSFLAAKTASIRAQSVEGEIHGGAIEPAGGVGVAEAWPSLRVELVEGVGGELFGLSRIAGETKKDSHQPWVIREEKLFEVPVFAAAPGFGGCSEGQDHLFTGVHV